MTTSAIRLFWASVITLACIAPAYAYVGPGPGLSMISSLFTLIGGVLLAFFMVLLYPIRLLMKRMRKNKGATDTTAKTPDE